MGIGNHGPYDGSALSVANEYVLITGHTGTHVDAPCHVDSKAISIEQVPCDRTMGTAVWLDLTWACSAHSMVEPAHLHEAEARGGTEIRQGDILLVHTGWANAAEARSHKNYIEDAPALSRAAGEWLRARGIKALGVDLATPDAHGATDLPVHMNFLRPKSIGLPDDEYILIYENLVNIEKIPARRFLFVGLPLPFRGATGSPVRAIAYV